MRYAGIALVCMVAAFGAAFLIRRAVDHGAAGPRGTVAADTGTAPALPSPPATGHAEDAVVRHRTHAPRLAAEFAPGVQRITRKRPKPKHKVHRVVSQSSASSSPTEVTSTPAYTTSTPTYTPTTTESSPTTGSSASSASSPTTHKSSGSGTGTTSIGGSGKGSGTTTIG